MQAGKFDAPVPRLADAVGRRDEKVRLTAAGGLDRRGRYALWIKARLTTPARRIDSAIL
jgi:hypothetical protein